MFIIEMFSLDEFKKQSMGISGEQYLVRVESPYSSPNFMPAKLRIDPQTNNYSWNINHWTVTDVSKNPVK
jgi:hypothetical protein